MLATSQTVAGWIEYLDGSDYNKALEHLEASIPKLKNINRISWLSLAIALKAATESRIDKSASGKPIKELEKALSLCRRKGRKNHLVEIYLIKGDFARFAADESTAVETYKKGLNVANRYSMIYYKSILNSRLK